MNTQPISEDQPIPEDSRDLLRLTTAGSVDDGKSTLIGRLLADSGALAADQMASLAAAAVSEGTSEIDLARITDGLTAEREQGITIDVAYRYFSTPKRSFILADVPGHEQYTRNMVTGASNADAALFLVDAQNGMTPQTRRHVCIAALLGIDQVVFAINKMDLVDFSEAAYIQAKDEMKAFCEGLSFGTVHYVPVSAKKGDNVVATSASMPWYTDGPLINILGNLSASATSFDGPFRMAVQIAARPTHNPEDGDVASARGLMGRIASGRVRVGERVEIVPGNGKSTVTSITTPQGPASQAVAGQSVTITLADQIDVGRGHMLAAIDNPPRQSREARALLCWLDNVPQDPRTPYLVRIGTKTLNARVAAPDFRIDTNTLDRVTDNAPLAANDIGETIIRLSDDIAFDPFDANPATGAFLVIDPRTNATVAAGMIESAL